MTELPRRPSEAAPDADHKARARTGPVAGRGRRPAVRPLQVVAAWIGAFLGIGLVAALVEALPTLNLLIVGSFGASAVLLYGAPRTPFSQPRNLVGGHLISAAIGVACYRYLPDIPMLQQATAVATAVGLMVATHTIHPPGGATALIAVIGPNAVYELGWGYLLLVLMGALTMLVVAIVVNNLVKPGSYPERWD